MITEHMKMCARAMELAMCHDQILTKALRLFHQPCRWVQTDIKYDTHILWALSFHVNLISQ